VGTAPADGGAQVSPPIRTPDQRVRVFVSSTPEALAPASDAQQDRSDRHPQEKETP
jgi:hypothetical protein